MNNYFISTLIIILILPCSSCGDCGSLADSYRDDHFNMILQNNPAQGRSYTLRGINPLTQNKEKYLSHGGFLGLPFRDLITIGDTLVKKQGELKVYIHKKDTVIVFPFKCEGEVYE